MSDNMSMSDVLALQGANNGGFGGNAMMLPLFLFFLLAFGGGFGGFGGFGNNGNAQMLNTDMQYTNLMSAMNNLSNTTSREISGVANVIGQGFTQTTNQNFGLSRDLERVNFNNTVGQANLSKEVYGVENAIQREACNINRGIDANRYEQAKSACEIITNANYNTRDITSSMNANTQAILNKLDCMRYDELRDQLEKERFEKIQLSNQLSNQTQTQRILDAINAQNKGAQPVFIVPNPCCPSIPQQPIIPQFS